MKIRNERGNTITHLTEIKRIIKDNYLKKNKPISNKSDNLGEIGKFLDRHKLLKLTLQ